MSRCYLRIIKEQQEIHNGNIENMNSTYEMLAINPPQKFVDLHGTLMDSIYADMTSKPEDLSRVDMLNTFLNIYKINIELTDATLVLLASPHVSHISSGIIIRSMLENIAMYSHLCASDPEVVKKYVKKINYFESKSESQMVGRLRSGHFANISSIDDSTTRSRLEPFGEYIMMTYDLLSSYTHAAPYITKQLAAGSEKIIDGKYNQLQSVYVIYSRLLLLACDHNTLDRRRYNPFINELNGLINFSNKYTSSEL